MLLLRGHYLEVPLDQVYSVAYFDTVEIGPDNLSIEVEWQTDIATITGPYGRLGPALKLLRMGKFMSSQRLSVQVSRQEVAALSAPHAEHAGLVPQTALVVALLEQKLRALVPEEVPLPAVPDLDHPGIHLAALVDQTARLLREILAGSASAQFLQWRYADRELLAEIEGSPTTYRATPLP